MKAKLEEKISKIENDIFLNIIKLNDAETVHFDWIKARLNEVNDKNGFEKLERRLNFILHVDELILPDQTSVFMKNEQIEIDFPNPQSPNTTPPNTNPPNPKKHRKNYKKEAELLKHELEKKNNQILELNESLCKNEIEISDLNINKIKMTSHLQHAARELEKLQECNTWMENDTLFFDVKGYKFPATPLPVTTKYDDLCYICLSNKGQAEYFECKHSICINCLYTYKDRCGGVCGICKKTVKNKKTEEIFNDLALNEFSIFN
jgi:hypothetical protein